jgi:hypothetical protein
MQLEMVQSGHDSTIPTIARLRYGQMTIPGEKRRDLRRMLNFLTTGGGNGDDDFSSRARTCTPGVDCAIW